MMTFLRIPAARAERNRSHGPSHHTSLDTLRWRRRWHTLRRSAGAVVAACCMALLYGGMMNATATASVPLASRHIARGTRLEESDFRISIVTAGEALRSGIAQENAIPGRIAQVDIAEGTILLDSLLRDEPQVPEGFTTMDIKPSNTSDSIVPGDTVRITASAGCTGNDTADTSAGSGVGDEPESLGQDHGTIRRPEYTSDQNHQPSGACTIAAAATVIRLTPPDSSDDQSTMVVALSPDEAFALIRTQAVGPIVAVRTG